MMPRLPSPMLRRLGIGAILLTVIAVTVLVPARHVLLPSWPDRVEELLFESEPGRVDRRFLPADARVEATDPLLARSRPITLWRIEHGAGALDYVWLAGVRDAEGRLLPSLPGWLNIARLDGPLPEPVHLVVVDAERETRPLDGADIRRMYRPNGLRLRQRAALWSDRLAERWRWPLTATADARMTPPPRSSTRPAPP